MKELYSSKKDCFGCGSCAAACPVGAVTMERDSEGFPYPVIDSGRCADCGKCRDACPAGRPAERPACRFYAVRCKDEQLLKKSASGGAFFLLAEETLRQGGLVCGACFDAHFRVRHVLSGVIGPMRKSKYVQSDMTDCFVPIRDALDGGRQVLFSGTPCQCHGLERFLGGRRDGLTLVSLICRGVHSPGLWEDYTAWLSLRGPLSAYDFRDKRRQNDAHTVSYTVGSEETAVSMHEDRLSRMYNKGLTYRPSCYACPYCRTDNAFDFTLGDFWGIERLHPPLADGKGTSLVIARGERAWAMMEAISDRALVLPCPEEAVVQPALVSPARESLLRKFLFQDFAKKGPDGCCDIPLILKKYGSG